MKKNVLANSPQLGKIGKKNVLFQSLTLPAYYQYLQSIRLYFKPNKTHLVHS